MGGSSRVTIGYRISLGVHFLFCRGPIDAVQRIRVDKKNIVDTTTTESQVTIELPDLFGGRKQEGGIVGPIDVEFGGPTQQPNDYLTAQTTGLIPAFRQFVGMVLRQVHIGNQPYLKPWDARLTRIHVTEDGQTQWYDAKAAIPGGIPRAEVSALPWSGYGSSDFIIGAGQEVSGGFVGLNTYFDGFIDSLRITAGVCRYKTHFIPEITEAFSSDDEHWSSVVVLNNFEGADGATPSTDDTGNALTWASDAAISTDQYKFGSSSGEFDGVNDYLRCTADTNLGESFTIEAWVYLRSTTTTSYGRPVVSCGPVSTVEEDLYFTIHGNNVKYVNDDPDDLAGAITGTLKDITLNEWHHVAVSRDEDTQLVRLYLDFEMVIGYASDMNPAHILREILTNPDWGMGYPTGDIGDSFQTAADSLYDEQFGLSLAWTAKKPIEEFKNDILDHIDASLYVSRETGQFELKLIRDDYALSSLITLDETNIVQIDDFTRTAFADFVNTVTVVYYEPEVSDFASVTVDDIALVQMQGAVIETQFQYPGIRNKKLAARVAQRELRGLSNPLIGCTITANREAASLNIGDAFYLSWDDLNIDSVIMRVQKLAFGDGKTNRVIISAIQDVFAIPEISYYGNAEPEVIDLIKPPKAAEPRIAFEAPYYLLTQNLGESETNSALSTNADAGYLVVAAGRANGYQINADLWVDDGGGYDSQDTLDFCPWAVPAPDSASYLLDETTETIFIQAGGDLTKIEPPILALMGDEWILINSINDGSDGVYECSIGRGCLDSVPQQHTIDSAGQYIFVCQELNGFSEDEYNDGETITAKILSNTLTEQLLLAEAPDDSVTMAQRAIRPYPPGNVKLNGERYPTVIGNGDLTVTWSHRDRTQQTTDTIYDHTAGDIGPETNTTYNIRFYSETGELAREVTGLTTTTYTWTTEAIDSGLIDSGELIPFIEAVQNESPELLWAMDDDSAGSCEDLSGNGNHGTFGSGVTIQEPPMISGGYSIVADASSNPAIDLGSQITANNVITAVMWFKSNSIPGSGRVLFGSFKTSTFMCWGLRVEATTGYARADLNRNSAGTDYLNISGTTNICDGERHLVAMSWDRSGDKKLRLYVDGQLEATSASWDHNIWGGSGHTIQLYHTGSDTFSFDACAFWFSHANDSKMLDLWESRDIAESEAVYESSVGVGYNLSLRVELESERDGYKSLQMHNITTTRV